MAFFCMSLDDIKSYPIYITHRFSGCALARKPVVTNQDPSILKKKGIPKTPSPATAASNPGDLDPADPKDEKDVLLSVLKVANGDRSLVRFETKKKRWAGGCWELGVAEKNSELGRSVCPYIVIILYIYIRLDL